MQTSARFPHLLRAPILSDLPNEAKASFLDGCAVKHFETAVPVLEQGDPTDHALLIAHGAVEISFVSEDGNQSIIFHAISGQVLGLTETLAERPCAASCVAFPNTTVLLCPKALLLEHMKSPLFIRNFAINTYEALQRDNTFKAVDQFYSVEQRICMYLLHLSVRNSKFTQSQSYLAKAVGCSRQTVNKEFGRLRDLSIIDQTRGEISVLDPAGLQRRIEELDISQTASRT